jgi:alanyl-tRNA synthetase
MGNNKHNLLRLVLARFYKHSRLSGIETRFFNRLMNTQAGAFVDSFNKWKALPERKDTEAFKKGSKFERSLNFLFSNNLKL